MTSLTSFVYAVLSLAISIAALVFEKRNLDIQLDEVDTVEYQSLSDKDVVRIRAAYLDDEENKKLAVYTASLEDLGN